MTEQEIRDGVAARQWFHCVQLPYGIVTPGIREPDAWQTYKLPERLDGKRVLDIGAWEGQFSFESERRGAKSVIAMDVWNTVTEPGSGGYGWSNFVWLRHALDSKVDDVHLNVYDLPACPVYDLVLFLEVLYHLQNPLLALTNVFNALVPDGLLCMETWIDAEWIDQPSMIFYPGSELNNDPTNWWGPNIKCVQSMAAAAGFKTCELIWWRQDSHFGGRGKRACFHAMK